MRRFGITPNSTATEVLDASFAMTPEQSANSSINDAWEALRITKTRLLADFFCLNLPAPGPAAPGSAHASSLAFALAAAMDTTLPDLPLPDVRPEFPPALRGEVDPGREAQAPAPFPEDAKGNGR